MKPCFKSLVKYILAQSIDGRGGSSERQHQESAPPRPWLPEPALPIAESLKNGRDQDRIRRLQESSLKCPLSRIPAQSQIFKVAHYRNLRWLRHRQLDWRMSRP